MVFTKTLAEIKTAFRNKSNYRSTGPISDTVLVDLINSAGGEFWEIVTEADPQHLIQLADISITSGTRDYALPSDHMYTVGIAVKDGSDDGYCICERIAGRERYGDYWADETSAKYEIRGNRLWLSNDADFTGTIRIEYIPTYTELSNDSDSLNCINQTGFDFIVYGALILACGKTEDNPHEAWVSFYRGARERLERFSADIGSPMKRSLPYRTRYDVVKMRGDSW